MSVALNPKLLEKPALPEAKEVSLEVPVKSLSLIDTERLQETMQTTEKMLSDTVNALRKLYDLNNATETVQIAEALSKTKEVADNFEEIKQVLNQIWQAISKKTELDELERDVLTQLKRELTA